MGTFPQTRAGAGYIARHARGELARGRAAVLLTALDACEDAPAGGDVPAVFHGVLRDLVLAARDLAGPAWLAATSDDPDIAAFTALQATPVPPSPAELDEIISRVLRARFAPPGPARDGGGDPGPAPGPATGHDIAARSHVPAASHSQRSPAGDQPPGRRAKTTALQERPAGPGEPATASGTLSVSRWFPWPFPVSSSPGCFAGPGWTTPRTTPS